MKWKRTDKRVHLVLVCSLVPIVLVVQSTFKIVAAVPPLPFDNGKDSERTKSKYAFSKGTH